MKRLNGTPKKKELRRTNNSYDLLQTDPIDINNIDSSDNDDIFNQTLDLSSVTNTYEDDFEDEVSMNNENTESLDNDDVADEVSQDEIEDNVDYEKDEEEQPDEIESELAHESSETSSTDIDTMFAIASSTVMEAKNIFSKNHEVKRQIDEKIKELDQLKKEHEAKKQADFDKIKAYKEEVYNKLKIKKDEIEKQIAKLKNSQAELEKSKNEFEEYKKHEMDQLRLIKAKQKKIIDEKKNELDSMEHDIAIQREMIEEDKRQLELDRIKYNADKNELSNNLLKFNELVSDFTINIDKFTDEEKPSDDIEVSAEIENIDETQNSVDIDENQEL